MKEMGKGCKPCTTSALFDYFGCGLTPPSLMPFTCKPCTTSALFEYFGCGLSPYGCQQNRTGNASTSSPVFLPAAWLTGKQKKQRPPTRSRKTLPFINDAPSGTRTLDPLIKSQLLYQLS